MSVSEDLTTSSLAELEPPASLLASRKRKAPTSEVVTKPAVKHRSSHACQSCRLRKVRCDVIANGSRCTNCRLDGMECVVLPSRRGKNGHTNVDSSKDASSSQSAQLVQVTHDSDPSIPIESSISPSGTAHVPICVTFDQDQPAVNDANRDYMNHTSPEAYEALLTPQTMGDTMNQHQRLIGKTSLPGFIAPLPISIPAEDVEFLIQKGALTVPESELQVEILRGYLFSVHPFMPMLNFKPFVRAVLHAQEDTRISLLLFQAVMFAGLHSLPMHVVHRLGFESTKHARKVFFNRVKLLYEFNVEPDDAAVLQSLILMSAWYSRWDDRRHTWHWTGLAYDLARSMGLHREPATRYASDEVRRFRRRLWWSLYIRDRFIALGTRRPMRIRDEDFDVAMLTLEDFHLEPVEETRPGLSLVPSTQERTSTALMCIQLARLGICIGHITFSQYTTLSPQSDVPHTMMVVPRNYEGRTDELESCDRELNEWLEKLETNVRRTATSTNQNDPDSCSEVHWTMLQITYLTAVNVLHRANALQVLTGVVDAQIAQNASRSKVKDAASRITKISQGMLRRDQVRFFGLIGVTALVAACLSHMLDISSTDEDVRDASTFRLCQSLEGLQRLREIYASADAAISFLASVIRTAGISVPAQVIGSAADSVSTPFAPIAPIARGAHANNVWQDPAGTASGYWTHSNEEMDADKTDWQLKPFSSLQQPGTGPPQVPIELDGAGEEPLLDGVMRPGMGERGGSPFGAAPENPLDASLFGHEHHGISKAAPTTGQRTPQFVSTPFEGFPNSAAGAAFFNWSGMDPTMGLFNYDFYSNAFEFLDGPLRAA